MIKNTQIIMSMIYKGRINKTIIIGAGEGAEANEWAEISNEVIAIDKNPTNYGFKSNVKFYVMDAHDIDKLNGIFDCIFLHHSLEHIRNPRLLLKKIKHCLSEEGKVIILVPNKRRLFSYFHTASLWVAIKWNLRDYKYRLRKKWDNSFGAHAGFTKEELFALSNGLFSIKDLTNQFYLDKYHKSKFVKFLCKNNYLSRYLLPSNIVILTKNRNNIKKMND